MTEVQSQQEGLILQEIRDFQASICWCNMLPSTPRVVTNSLKLVFLWKVDSLQLLNQKFVVVA